MQYSPKLKGAMEEIKAILKKNDIGAMVVLHMPGFSESLLSVDTSYSCASVESDKIRFKTNPEDSKEVKMRSVSNTIELFSSIMSVGGPMVLIAGDSLELMKKRFDFKSGPESSSSHTEQNN